MELSPRETQDLARFFARRFPRREEIDQLARQAGIQLDDTLVGEDETLWSSLLGLARAQGRTRALARQAARQDLADANLQEVCRLLAGSERPALLPWALGGLGLLGLLGLGLGLWLAAARPEPLAEPAAPADATPSVTAPPTAAAPTKAATADAAAPETPAPIQADPLAIQARPEPRAAAPAPTGQRCPGRPGELIGYWYAGRVAPGQKGEIITLSQAANVRADYPDRHNGYDARAPLRCGLRAGDRQKLSADPVAVPGGVYWVPLYGGDLLTD